jgi:hypothetical protein
MHGNGQFQITADELASSSSPHASLCICSSGWCHSSHCCSDKSNPGSSRHSAVVVQLCSRQQTAADSNPCSHHVLTRCPPICRHRYAPHTTCSSCCYYVGCSSISCDALYDRIALGFESSSLCTGIMHTPECMQRVYKCTRQAA